MQKKGINNYWREFLVREAIEAINIGHVENGGDELTVSECRKLRNEIFDKAFAEKAINGNQPITPAKLMEIMDNIAEEKYNTYVFGDDKSTNNEFYQDCINEFMDLTGATTKDGRARNYGQELVLPISPFDPKFTYRADVMKQGTAMMYVKDADLMKYFGGDLTVFDKEFEKHGDIQLFEQSAEGYSPVGYLTSPDDRSGLSALAPYIKTREYNSVRNWVNDIDPSQRMSDKGIARSRAILEYLVNNGIDYEVVADQNKGQIKAKLLGTKIEVRLTDTLDNEHFVGRIYEGGTTIAYGTNYKDPNTKKYDMYNNVTPEEAVDLLRYARGENLQREDGSIVGERSTFEKAGRYKVKTEINGRTVERSYNGVGEYNNAYKTSDNLSVMYKPYKKEGAYVPEHSYVHIRTKDRDSNTLYFGDAEVARAFLVQSIEEAKEHLRSRINVEKLEEIALNHDDNLEFDYDNQSDIKVLQSDIISNIRASKEEGTEYDAHAAIDEYLRIAVGEFELDTDPESSTYNKRFNPVGVANYMGGGYSYFRNIDNIVAASRVYGINPDEVLDPSESSGVGRQLIKFDKESAVPMKDIDNPFVQKMFNEIKQGILSNACYVNDEDILFDENGIVSYTARQANKMMTRKPNGEVVSDSEVVINGQIGQIFVPQEDGMIRTRFADTGNYYVAPGYEAYVVPDDGSGQTLEERTRLRGYEQLMAESIRYRLRSDLSQIKGHIGGSPTNVNGVYRRLYGTRHDLDFYERSAEDGLSDEWRKAIISSEVGRVKYSNELKEGSTIDADFTAQSTNKDLNYRNDNFRDPYQLTGRRNMSILTEEGNGYFDPIMTGGAMNQGIVRFLVEGAKVDADGRIIKSEIENDRAPLMKLPELEEMKYDPYDRQQMTVSNILQASSITDSVGVANMTAGGWNFDDGIVISKEFAERYQVRGSDGQLRDLVPGDKLSDMHGNKGVISLVVDRDMSYGEYKAEKLEDMVTLFKENENLDIVMAPFPTVSRFNGGSTRELMKETNDLVLTKNDETNVIKGGIGHAKFIVTHMAVDAKTKVYDDDAMAEGKGRKASGQLAWALNAQGCTHIMNEFYGSNNRSLQVYREMLITMGLDMDEIGNFRETYEEHNGEHRNRFAFPDFELKETSKGDKIADIAGTKTKFIKEIGENGGFMEIPFELKFPTGKAIPEWDGVEPSILDGTTYRLPVLSADVRSGREFADGEQVMLHDYTHHYANIMETSLRYVHAQEELARHETEKHLKANKVKEYEDYIKDAPDLAQSYFKRITDDLEVRRFSGKHNMIRDGIMANKLPNSATAVWLGDPRLDIDTVAVSGDICDKLNLRDGNTVILWRDPMLRDSGVRAFTVKRDDNLKGIAINPVMDKSFDGDFDGDAIALVKPLSKESIKEAREKLSVKANLLDYGVKDDKTGLHPLMMQDSLDMKVLQYTTPEAKEFFDKMTEWVNNFEAAHKEGKLSDEDLDKNRTKAVKELSGYYKAGLQRAHGEAVITYDNMEDHLKSVHHACIETGAKGSVGKMRHYMKHAGFSDGKEDGELDFDRLFDKSDTFATMQDHNDTQYATAAKTWGTGTAGMFSQRGIAVLRNRAPKEVLEMTYTATQSMLQAKHDPIEARHKYEMLKGTARSFWQGYEMIPSGEPGSDDRTWTIAKDHNGNPIKASKEYWVESMIDFYSDPNGMNVKVNNDCIRIIADKLVGEDGKIRNLEREAKEQLGAPMDRLAYGGDFKLVQQFAKEGANLFAGEGNKEFAPRVVKNNLKLMYEAENAGTSVVFNPIMKKDTQVQPVAEQPVAEQPVAEQPVAEQEEPLVSNPWAQSFGESTVTENVGRNRVVKDLVNYDEQQDASMSL